MPEDPTNVNEETTVTEPEVTEPEVTEEETGVVTSAEVLAYLGIDEADAMILSNVRRSISVADAFLKGAVGENYPTNDPRAKELALILIADLYDNRSMMDLVNKNIRRLVTDFLLQLRLELKGE